MLFSKRFKTFLIVPVLALALGCGAFFWWQQNLKPISQQRRESAFVIEQGQSLGQIAFNLENKGIIRSGLAFKLYVMAHGLSGQLQAGYFKLDLSQPVAQIADQLTHGATDIWLTFPEGWRREEYAVRLASSLVDFDADQFINLTGGLEGQLFPDTYLIPRQATAVEVIEILQNNFDKKIDDQLIQQAQDSGLNKNQLLTLASLVEREVRSNQDRALVAGILKKRLANDWPLQIDATLQYAKASVVCADSLNCNWWPVAIGSDKALDSPFNTYSRKGLPPQPICNPSLSAIKAVVVSQDSDFWFYLSDSQGQTHFAETIEEHNDNINKYL